jgi:hypothetical protein
MMKKHNRFALVAGLLLLAIPLALVAATFTWQARVQDKSGTDLQGPLTMGLRIYNAGGTLLWGETQTLTADRGIVSAELGRTNAIPDSLLLNPGLSLGVPLPGDAEMAPRTPLFSTWKVVSANRVSGRAIRAGEGTLVVADAQEGSVAIIFPEPFAAPPVVSIGALKTSVGGEYFLVTQVANMTASGCVVHFSALGGATATGTAAFDWIAIGE